MGERLTQVQDPRARDRESVVTNVKSQLYAITRDECIMAKVNAKELIVVGGFYEISSGIVDFFLQITEAKPQTPKRSDKLERQISRTKSFDGGAFLVVKESPPDHAERTTLEVERT